MPSRDARRYLLWWSAGTWGRWSLTHHQRSSRHSVKISHMEGMEEMEGMEGAWGQKDALLQFERCWRVWTQKLSPSILVPCLTWALDCFPFHCWVVRHHTSGPKMIRKRNLCAAVVPSTQVFRCSIEGSRVCLSWMSKTHPSPQRGKLQKVLGAQSGGPWNLVCFGLFRFVSVCLFWNFSTWNFPGRSGFDSPKICPKASWKWVQTVLGAKRLQLLMSKLIQGVDFYEILGVDKLAWSQVSQLSQLSQVS